MIPIRKGYAALNHGHVHYREAGNGPCLVFLHQAAGDSRTFEPVIDLLADGYRCVALDLPGFGMSDYASQGLSVPGYAAIVVETLDSLGVEHASIFGQHGGAAVAAELAAAHATRVDRLILSGAPLYTKEQGETNLAGFPRLVLKEDGSHLIDFWSYMATWTPPKDDAEARAMTYELVGRLRPGPRNVEAYAAAFTLDSLSVEHASIFGQHGGAAVAAQLAAAHAARVDHLILSGAPLYTKEQGETNLAGFPRLVLKEDGSHLIDFWTYMATWTPPKDDAEARAMTYELVGRLRPGPRNVEAYAAAFTYDLEGSLRRITAPTLVLAGENAPGVKDLVPVCSFLANAKSAIVPNVGNWLEVEPRILVDILKDFLKAER